MKKVLLAMLLCSVVLPALSSEVSIPKPESVKYYSETQDARFRYDLPSGNPFSFKKDTKTQTINENDEITLDESAVKPVRKVIKKIGDSSANQEVQTPNPTDSPMNYNSFPQFFDPNNMMQQQFMPTASF